MNADQTPRTLLGWTVPDHVTFAFEVALVCRHTEHGDDYPAIWWSAPDRIGRFLQAHAHGFVAEYQPADPETASERPDAGRETAPDVDCGQCCCMGSCVGVRAEVAELQLAVANQRASSWWEAAKEFARDTRRARKAIDRQVLDVANAMARNAEFRARADVAEAARDEAIEMVKTCMGHPARQDPMIPSHPELIQAANGRADAAEANLEETIQLANLADAAALQVERRLTAERDEALEKLDEIRDRAVGFHAFLLGPGSRNPDQVRTRAVGALDGIRAVFEDATDREEPARAVDVRHIGRSWEDHPLEDACPCPQEPCGLVSTARVAPECQHHPGERAKTIRQSHRAAECPARSEVQR